MKHTAINIEAIPKIMYNIEKGQVYILESKTNVCYNEELELVVINATKLSRSLSMRFKYILGSLNFLFEEVSKGIKDISEKDKLRNQIITLFENLQDELRIIKSENHVERLVDFLTNEKVKLKSRIQNYL